MTSVEVLRIQMRNLPPEGIRIEGELAPAALDIPEEDRTVCLGPLRVRLHVRPTLGAILADGGVQVRLRRRCDRCLVYFTEDLGEIAVSHPYPAFSAEVLDLTDDLRDDILLAFPERSLCRPDCLGLCPQCGQNLNAGDCGCRQGDGETEAWHVLDRLRLPEAATDDELK
jgi:uncharacterized protein